jgi:hypothetical protein
MLLPVRRGIGGHGRIDGFEDLWIRIGDEQGFNYSPVGSLQGCCRICMAYSTASSSSSIQRDQGMNAVRMIQNLNLPRLERLWGDIA